MINLSRGLIPHIRKSWEGGSVRQHGSGLIKKCLALLFEDMQDFIVFPASRFTGGPSHRFQGWCLLRISLPCILVLFPGSLHSITGAVEKGRQPQPNEKFKMNNEKLKRGDEKPCCDSPFYLFNFALISQPLLLCRLEVGVPTSLLLRKFRIIQHTHYPN